MKALTNERKARNEFTISRIRIRDMYIGYHEFRESLNVYLWCLNCLSMA